MKTLMALALTALGVAPVSAQTQGPIRLIFDLHCDPIPNSVSLSIKQAVYQLRTGNVNWVLDQTEPLGVPIAFLSVGLWMELAVQDGVSGPGATLIRRLYDSGGQIASHSHSEYRAGAFDWPSYPTSATLAQSQQSWQDNIDWVDQGLLTAYSGVPPEPLSVINNVKGAHLPDNEPDFHTLMQTFGITAREPGPEEDYYGWYGHHIWNPYRPSAVNGMDEDLGAPFVQITQGSVIGLAQVHHNVFQDMTAPHVKRQLLQLYLNWRYRDRHGLPEQVWCWGWGSHAHDFDAGGPSRAALVEVLPWIDAHFAGRVEPTGSVALVWDTHRGVAQAYLDWEAAHPGQSSFAGHSLAVDWNEYPYLRAVAEELQGFGWTADLALAPGVEAYSLAKAGLDAVVLWSDAGDVPVDLSGLLGPVVRVVGLETGLLLGTDPAAVVAGAEPLFVTEETYDLFMTGTPGLGSTVTFDVVGPPGSPAALLAALAPADTDLAHIGHLQIDPAATLMFLALGTTAPGGAFTVPITLPNNPALIGLQIWFQGLLTVFDGNSPKLTLQAPDFTIVP